jgi:hypothetical protein
MSTLTGQPSAPIVAPLLANWLRDLLSSGRPQRISTMLRRGPDAERNLSNAQSLDHAMTYAAALPLSPTLGVER